MFVNNYCLSMNCIIAPLNGCGGIYLGNLDAAKDSQLLTQYNIGAVLQVLDQSVPVRGAQKLWIMAEDSEEFPLNKYFEQAIKFIENQTKNQCSCSLLCRYLKICSYFGCLSNVKIRLDHKSSYITFTIKRRIVNPNPGFMIQLQDFQQKLRNNNQESTLSLATIQHESQNDQQNNQNCQREVSPLHKISRLDEFNNKLDQFRNQLRIKHKVC